MLTVGLLMDSPVWPFHQWHLWARILPERVDYYEVWLEDDDGKNYIYDLRAVPPLNPSYLNAVHAPKMFDSRERESVKEKARWLVDRANSYQLSQSITNRLRFPEREYSHYQSAGLFEGERVSPQWPVEHGRFVCLVIKKKRAVFSKSPGYNANFTLLDEVRLP